MRTAILHTALASLLLLYPAAAVHPGTPAVPAPCGPGPACQPGGILHGGSCNPTVENILFHPVPTIMDCIPSPLAS